MSLLVAPAMVSIHQILLPEHALCGVQGGSKKRTLEYIATFVGGYDPTISTKALLNALLMREKLGSTGLGNGVAIPHCRLSSCKQTIALFLQLAEPIDFNAIDRHPVDLIFALIIPQDSINEHLELLRQLAEKFNNPRLCEALRNAETGDSLHQLITSTENETV